MPLPNMFTDSPLQPLGINAHIEDVIGRVNWLIADFNERHPEDARQNTKDAEQLVGDKVGEGAPNNRIMQCLCVPSVDQLGHAVLVVAADCPQHAKYYGA